MLGRATKADMIAGKDGEGYGCFGGAKRQTIGNKIKISICEIAKNCSPDR